MHLTRLRKLVIRRQTHITEAAFAHLSGIRALNMRGCTQPCITDAAFVHLCGIHAEHEHVQAGTRTPPLRTCRHLRA